MRVAAWLLVLLLACQAPPSKSNPGVKPGDRLPRTGDEIVVCGEFFHTGARVVLWMDAGGYDAYRPHAHRDESKAQPRRFGTYRRNLPPEVEARVKQRGWTRDDLARVVRQIVVHYDAAGTSARCFEILHDLRGLSAHFMIDRDGTIYQTLDAKERAWHAGRANDASIGIEIANLGAYPQSQTNDREVTGEIQGTRLWQRPFADVQYEALARLCVALIRALPRIRAEFPRDAKGHVVPIVLPDNGASFAGILGHYHLTTAKVDPGPAFDWTRLAARMEELR